jgi:3-hydroxymyristoyl/3-hydroxydecanoyl-(acyl carrier protein) dehydratase
VRWLLFDRVTSFVPASSVTAVKHVSISDEALREHFPRRPLFPATMVLEAMTQALGWLAIATQDYRVSAVLTLCEDAVLPPDLEPGVRLDLEGTLVSTSPKGSVGRARALVDGREVASVGRLLFGHVPHPDPASLRRRLESVGGRAGGAS